MRTPSPMGDMDIKKFNSQKERKAAEKEYKYSCWTTGIEIPQVPSPRAKNEKYRYPRITVEDMGYDATEQGDLVCEVMCKNEEGSYVRDMVTVTTRDKKMMMQQQLDFPADPPPRDRMYLIVGAEPVCFSNYYPVTSYMDNAKNHTVCFGCKKQIPDCDELLFGRFCLQACYAYFSKPKQLSMEWMRFISKPTTRSNRRILGQS